MENILSIDFEESVIKKMIHRGVPTKYEVMDMLNNTYADGSFYYVLDKGTLDALCSDKTPETA